LELIQDGQGLQRLPATTAQVYLDYIRRLLKQAQVRGPVLAAIAEIAQLTVRRGNGPSAIPLDSAVATLDHLLGVGNGELLVDHLFAVGILRKIDRVGDQTIVFVIDSFL
jgi:hypothetical protein